MSKEVISWNINYNCMYGSVVWNVNPDWPGVIYFLTSPVSYVQGCKLALTPVAQRAIADNMSLTYCIAYLCITSMEKNA